MKSSCIEYHTITPNSDIKDLPIDVKHLTIDFLNTQPQAIVDFFKNIENVIIKLESLTFQGFPKIEWSTTVLNLRICLLSFIHRIEPTKVIINGYSLINESFILALGQLFSLKEIVIEDCNLYMKAVAAIQKTKIQSVILNNNLFYDSRVIDNYNSFYNFKQKELRIYNCGYEETYNESEVIKITKLKDFILSKFSKELASEIRLEDAGAFKFYQHVGKPLLKYLFPNIFNTGNLFSKVDDMINNSLFKFTCVSKLTVFEIFNQDCVKVLGESLGPQSLLSVKDFEHS